jgi:DNA repair exonuclease SbcCD ATPase subunit
MNRGYDAGRTSYGVDYPAEPPSLEVAFTEKQAEHALGAYERLKDKKARKESAKDEINKLEARLQELEARLQELEDLRSEGVEEEFKHHTITLAKGGIAFGCTKVDSKTLKAIAKLVKK